jgi:hypothetical protein
VATHRQMNEPKACREHANVSCGFQRTAYLVGRARGQRARGRETQGVALSRIQNRAYLSHCPTVPGTRYCTRPRVQLLCSGSGQRSNINFINSHKSNGSEVEFFGNPGPWVPDFYQYLTVSDDEGGDCEMVPILVY